MNPETHAGSPPAVNAMPRQSRHWLDPNGNPGGGCYSVPGLIVLFQDGPIKEQGVNGAQVEDLLQAARERLQFLNEAGNGKFASDYNAAAIAAIRQAEEMLLLRTQEREGRGVEGTSQV